MSLLSWFSRRGTFGWLAGGIVLFVTVFSLSAQDTAWVDADGGTYGDGTNDRNFTSLDDVLAAIQNEPYDVEVVMFAGDNQHTYTWNTYVDQSLGSIRFLSSVNDPDRYPVINRDDGTGMANFFVNNDSLIFQEIAFTGGAIDMGNATSVQVFVRCVFQGLNGDIGVYRGGGSGGSTYFINCLFTQNTCTDLFYLNFWQGGNPPVLSIINCTIDDNGELWYEDESDAADGISIVNCIFSNNSNATAAPTINSKITYSLVEGDASGFGTGCVSGNDPDYLVSSRSAPSDWRPSPSSPARNIGTSTGAPPKDISDTARVQDETDKVDAGCWDIRDSISPPSFTVDLPEDTAIVDGNTLTLTVAVDGTEPVALAWFAVGDATELGDETDLVLADLTITDDSMKVFCEATNERGTVSSDTVTIVIVEPPVVMIQPEDFYGFIGDDADFSITATGKLLSYTWMKGDSVKPLQTTSEYTSVDIESADSGALYWCIISNIAGSDTSDTAVLHVIPDQPVIRSVSNDTVLSEGGSVTFRITATGRAALAYSWIEVGNGTELSDADTLLITDAEVTDSTFYRCIVSNSEGADSAAVKLVVLPGSSPVITDQSATDIGIREGEDLTFSVTAEGGGTFTYIWYKDGFSGDDEVGTGSAFSITSVEENDSGVYRCIVSNGVGSDTSQAITVSIITSEVYNLLSLDAQFVDPAHVRLLIGNFANLPSSASSPPYVDSIAVWYDDLTFPEGPFSTEVQRVFVFALSDMADEGDETYSTVVEFDQVPASCVSRYFAAAPVWKDPDTIPLATTSEQRATVEMCATETLPNSMVLMLDYEAVSDSVSVSVSNLTSLNRDSLMYLIIRYTFGESGTPDSVEIFTGEQLPDASTDVFTRTFKDERLAGDEDSLSVSILWRGILGNYSSAETKKVTVGNLRPENTAVLHADTAGSTWVSLSWEGVDDDAVDSVRLWWGRLQLPESAVIDTGVYSSRLLAADETSADVQDLVPAQKYYFGLQVLKGSVWSLIPEDARDTISTGSRFSDSILNTITLTGISFDSLTNEFTCAWDVDTTGVAAIEILETGIVWAVNEAPAEELLPDMEFGVIDSSLSVKENTITFAPDGGLQYSSTYHFALLLRRKGDVWTSATDESRGTVNVPAPKLEEITYFNNTDTVTAFGGEVWFWKTGDGVVSVTDTIRFFMPKDTPEGFVIVCRTGFDLVHDRPSDRIVVGLRYDTALVDTLPLTSIRMYQYDKSTAYWYVIDEVTLDTEKKIVSTTVRPEDDSLPFILMIDTMPPVPEITTDTTSVAVANEDIIDSIIITDNIANGTVQLTFWYPDEERGAQSFTCSSTIDTLVVSVPKDSLTALKSIRAFVTVSDGIHSKTVEVTRKIHRENADPIFADSMRWVPVFTTAELENPSVEVAMKSLGQNGTWDYNKKFYRIFRWVDTASGSSSKDVPGYLEYSSKNSDLFRLDPGRVLWVKAREGIDISSLGSGTTVDMKKPFEIVCNDNAQWTDFALPYNFSIRVGDILEATSNDEEIRENISVYRWVMDEIDSIIYPTPKYLPRAIGLDSLTTSLTYKIGNDGVGSYSVYNKNEDPVILRIPAVPADFSRISEDGISKQRQREGWTVLVTAKSELGTLPPVCCGYSAWDNDIRTTYPIVPSFGKQRITVVPPKATQECGACIYHESTEGGNVFPLEFTNDTKQRSMITYRVDKVTTLPQDYFIAMYSPADGKGTTISGNGQVSVGGRAKEKRWLLVGDSSFIASWNTRFTQNNTFTMLRLFPNPCRGALQIRYSLPYDDVHHLTINVFNQLGRRVWVRELTGGNLTAGENAVVWNPVSEHSRLASGTYFIRMSIYSSKGAVIGSKMRRFLYLP